MTILKWPSPAETGDKKFRVVSNVGTTTVDIKFLTQKRLTEFVFICQAEAN